MSLFRSVFGPSRDEVWGRLAAEVEGRFREGGWLASSVVEVDVGPWTVALDSFTQSTGKHSTTYTRLRTPFANAEGFRFDVSPQTFLSGIGKVFGMQDVEIGVPEFDAAWVIQGSDEAKLRAFFRDDGLRTLLRGAGPVSFRIVSGGGFFGPKLPAGTSELVLVTVGTVKDMARLKLFFALFAETLELLVQQGHAGRPG